MVFSVRYGGKKGKKQSFTAAKDLIAIRFGEDQSFSRMVRTVHFRPEIANLSEVARFEDARVSILKVPGFRGIVGARDSALTTLKSISGLRFAGRVLQDRKSRRPVLYTENFFVRFHEDVGVRKCAAILKRANLRVKRKYDSLSNAYFVAAEEGTGAEKIFALAEELLEHEDVELCHPELIRERSMRAAHPAQWHLMETRHYGPLINAHAHVEDAWALSTGQGAKICVIDDGVDIDHQDFALAGKVLGGFDATERDSDPRPKNNAFPMSDYPGDAHGTSCAGVACASGEYLATGVAPDAHLLPVRLVSGLGSMDEHDAIIWAVDNGADIISCSWGPEDGDWSDPNDPLHHQITLLPDSTRTALEYATTYGRNGRGCVIVWAAGNGGESVDNDGYASSDLVMAVAACNDRSERSVYSDFGYAIWCAFPSNDFELAGEPVPLTPGIWTTDRADESDEGYNPHFSGGDADGKYTGGFGGTSSSCPGVAGVAALMLSRNPNLHWTEVSEIIAETCDKIDARNGDYDPATGHSYMYGFGRVNARNAVAEAISRATPSTTTNSS